MKRISSILLAGAIGLAGPAHADFKCWTNKEGVRECGNTIPPEYSQQKTEVVNERGMTVEVNERAKTKEELAAEARAARLEKKQLAKERRRREEQQRRDRVLLATFATEEDITMARDRQLASIDGTIELTRVAIGKLEEKLADYRKRAAALESRGKETPEDLQQDIDTVQSQIANKEAYVSNKKAEKLALREKYDADLEHFRKLHAQRAE